MNFKILIAEDEYKIREVLCDYFRSKGDVPFEAENGEKALEMAQGLEFDAVYVFDAERYDTKKELRLFYTVCTRAMHKLTVYGEHK